MNNENTAQLSLALVENKQNLCYCFLKINKTCIIVCLHLLYIPTPPSKLFLVAHKLPVIRSEQAKTFCQIYLRRFVHLGARSHPDNPGHPALRPTELLLREEAGLAGGGGHGRVLGVVADVAVVLLPVGQEGEDGVDQEEEDHGENNDLLHTDAQL